MEQTKKSTFKLLFYLKKNELKKNGNVGTLFKLTTSGRGKLTSRFAGEDFQFVCIQAVQKMSLFFPFTSNNLPVIMVTNL